MDTTEARNAYLAVAPVSRRQTLERAYSGTASPRAAIKAKCLECTDFAPQEITACSSALCPLWAYRPYQTKRKSRPKEGKSTP